MGASNVGGVGKKCVDEYLAIGWIGDCCSAINNVDRAVNCAVRHASVNLWLFG